MNVFRYLEVLLLSVVAVVSAEAFAVRKISYGVGVDDVHSHFFCQKFQKSLM